jgi:hypothetical protein
MGSLRTSAQHVAAGGGGSGRVGRPPATFPATFPVDPKTCWISYGMYGGTYLGVLGPPVGEILIKPASVITVLDLG